MRTDTIAITETRPRDLWIALGIALALHGFAAAAALKWYVAALERPSAGASATTVSLAAYSDAPQADVPQPEPETPKVEPPKPEPAPVRRAAPQEPKPAEVQAEEVPAPPQSAAAGPAGLAREGAAETGVGQETIEADYFATLAAWIARHKQYPRMAKRQRIEGEGHVLIHVARDGTLIDFRIVRGTGSVVLDRELSATVTRAAPLPPFPPGLNAVSLEVVQPIVFELTGE
ncbi:MAG: energy transducer TonB [Parvibaculum sp.]|uniref:energy transducer TonB family protein n=1 Tax=Parvibaculum sp. TaxID=2024848 RepID=UPI002727B63A|nr:energy transducer TonB [Parvibaculum sp.]MDO8838836.1 energy transducer TonB [Parvibaculum sp.]